MFRSLLVFVAIPFFAGVVPSSSTSRSSVEPSLVAVTTLTVTNTNNTGPGSLRQAILDANANAGADTIAFNIPGAGVHTITPLGPLPAITDPVVIDGYSQPGASPNTLADGDNAILLIELNGRDVGGRMPAPGLNIRSSNCTVRGLVINRFGGDGILLYLPGGATMGNVIEGNFIGTDPTGKVGLKNGSGIEMRSSQDNLIGGTTPAARNVISGNDLVGIMATKASASTTIQGNLIGTDLTGTVALGNHIGIWLDLDADPGNSMIGGVVPGARNLISGNRSSGVQISASSRNNQLLGNLIGTDITGTKPLRNAGDGVIITGDALSNRIGGTAIGEGNTIAFNGGNGIALTNFVNTGNALRGNSIFSNELLGIDLARDGVTTNDANDTDPGPNNLQNFPVITSVTTDTNRTTITGTLNSTPSTTYSLNFYSSSACDPSGNGEGAVPFGGPFAISVTTNANGNANFGVAISIPLPVGQVLTATATDPAGNTSEFSACDSSKAAGAVQFTASTFKLIEDVGFITLQMMRTGGSSGSLTVDYSTADITATAGQDYTPISGTLNFSDGETSKSVDIPISDDIISEPAETFAVRLRNATNVDSLGSPNEEIFTIQDRNTVPVLSINEVNVTEGDTGTVNAAFVVTLSAATGRTIMIDYHTSQLTATSGVDFQPVSGTLVFAPRVTSQTVSVPIIGDTIHEFEETFNLLLTNPTNATLASGGAIGTIIDNDPAPTVSISDVAVSDGSGPANAIFSVTLSNASDQPVTVRFLTTGGTATAGADFQSVSGTLTFNPGVTTQNITVPIIPDSLTEGNEMFTVNLSEPANASLADAQGLCTISDGQPSQLPTISINDITISEGDGSNSTVDFMVTRSGSTDQQASVQFTTVPGTAAANVDYLNVSGAMLFGPGVSSRSISVTIVGDFRDEFNESFSIVLSDPTNATIADAEGTATILDNDPQPTLAINDTNFKEGDSGTTSAFFIVTLSAASEKPVSFDFSIGALSAIAGSDYVDSPGIVTFNAGEVVKNLAIGIIGDTIYEPNETFLVQLSKPKNVTLGRSEVAGTIINDDIRLIQFSSPTYSVSETGPGVEIVINRLGDTSGSASVSCATNDNAGSQDCNVKNGIASRRCDYINSPSTITFAAGETTKSVFISVVDDAYSEGSETFTVSLSNALGTSLGTPSTATVTILDNEGSADGANPIDGADFFVRQQYLDFLGREPDPAGKAFWTDNISKCSNPARRPSGQTETLCTLRQRESTSAAFVLSPEFQYTGYYVYRMYVGALGRQPKLSEFITDTQFVANGIIINGQLSAAKINQNKAAFAQQFENCVDAAKSRCAEFKARFEGLDNRQYVDKLFQATGVNASDSDRVDLVNAIGANQTRASVLQKIVDGINVISEGNQQFTTSYGQAFYNAEFNRAFVQMEYFGYLKRDPDEAGYVHWLSKLNQYGGNFVNAEMVLAFISSPEYRARFGQP